MLTVDDWVTMLTAILSSACRFKIVSWYLFELVSVSTNICMDEWSIALCTYILLEMIVGYALHETSNWAFLCHFYRNKIGIKWRKGMLLIHWTKESEPSTHGPCSSRQNSSALQRLIHATQMWAENLFVRYLTPLRKREVNAIVCFFNRSPENIQGKLRSNVELLVSYIILKVLLDLCYSISWECLLPFIVWASLIVPCGPSGLPDSMAMGYLSSNLLVDVINVLEGLNVFWCIIAWTWNSCSSW